MQRRWAAVCLAFFLVMAGGAYATMALAEAPTLDIEGDTYQNNDTFATNGTTYTVQVEGGSGSLVYNETVPKEESWPAGEPIEYADGNYNVTVESGEDPSRFALVEEFDVEAILANDSRVDNQTYEADDGTRFVRYRNGTTQPVEEYLPEPNQEVFAEGDTVEQAGETKTVDNVTAEEVTVTWETEEQQTTDFAHGENVTVDNQTYVATFPADDTVKISPDVEGYQEHAADVDYHEERLSGLNYVIFFSLGTSFLLAALAFLPRRG